MMALHLEVKTKSVSANQNETVFTNVHRRTNTYTNRANLLIFLLYTLQVCFSQTSLLTLKSFLSINK